MEDDGNLFEDPEKVKELKKSIKQKTKESWKTSKQNLADAFDLLEGARTHIDFALALGIYKRVSILISDPAEVRSLRAEGRSL